MPGVYARGVLAGEITVRDERASSRQAHLPAVRVARQDERGAVTGHRVEDPRVGGVREPNADVSVTTFRRRLGVVVVAEVWVVDAHQRDAGAAHHELAGCVVEVFPSEVGEPVAEFVRGEALGGDGAWR